MNCPNCNKECIKSNDEKAFEEFMNWLNSVPYKEKAPFCPFDTIHSIGYCDLAYSVKCFDCEERIDK